MKTLVATLVLIAASGGLLWQGYAMPDGSDWFKANEPQIRRILSARDDLEFEYLGRSPIPGQAFDFINVRLRWLPTDDPARDKNRRKLPDEPFQFVVSRDGDYFVYNNMLYDLKDPFRLIREAISLEDSPSVGRNDAPVVLVMYSDYTCVYCRRFYLSFQKELLAHYEGKVRLVHKLFPAIGMRAMAQETSVASMCAFRQSNEAFWRMHDQLFNNVERFGEGKSYLLEAARQSNLRVGEFQSCLDSGETLPQVARSQQEGVLLRLDGTPSFFINGRPLFGVPSAEVFYKLIDEELVYATAGEPSGG